MDQRIAHLAEQNARQEYRLGVELRRSKRNATQAKSQLGDIRAKLDKSESENKTFAVQLDDRQQQLTRLSTRLDHALEELGYEHEKTTSLEAQLERLAETLRHRIADLLRATATIEKERQTNQSHSAELTRRLKRAESQLEEMRKYTRDVESRYLATIASNTWKAMEPVREIMRRVRGRLPPEPFLPRMAFEEDAQTAAESGANTVPTHGQSTANLDLPVDDVVRKLWGGFSSHALNDLHQCENDSNRDRGERVLAAWNLARWTAANGEWEVCRRHLGTIGHLDKRFFRAKRTRILLIETLVRVGDIEKAVEYAEYGWTRTMDGNFLCGISNALLSAQGQDHDEKDRLSAINRLFRNAGLAELAMLDPDSGVAYGNLVAPCDPITDTDLPLVSILMAVYNADAFLVTAIRSLLAQTWQNIEIIAVDDASTDDSWKLLQDLSVQDPRLRVFRNELNTGAYPTRNTALAQAAGELITVHDSDDWSHPQMIEEQARALLSKKGVIANFSAMTRVLPNLEFSLRPERTNLEYVHRSYPSLLIRRGDLDCIGQWDSVAANADDELVQRIRAVWGSTAIEDIHPTIPLSFFLRHRASLTEQKDTHLRSLTFGVRHEYAKQAEFWRKNVLLESLDAGQITERTDNKVPFPIPSGLARKDWIKDPVYDLVIISDLGLQGGTRRCNEGYIEAATALGMRVGLFHWPRYDLKLSEIAGDYRRLSYRQNVDIIVPEDTVECSAVLIHHPPILRYRIDALPRINTNRVGILVNQLPMQLRGEAPHYYDRDVSENLCVELFDQKPIWIPISPLARRCLSELGYERLHRLDWFPPLDRALPSDRPPIRRATRGDGKVILGRHSRDHWTKWPEDSSKLLAAYCADSEFSVRLMGGTSYAKKILHTLPANWETIAFDKLSVAKFLSGINVFLHFVHDNYIEEFGRNVMEAMAQGVPAILPYSLKETFEDAAIYCAPEDVLAVVQRLVADNDAYTTQSERGYRFVLTTSDQPIVIERLRQFVQSESATLGLNPP
jgi:glycosyltransferase involved in cell wall biosynthesis